jgi:hypothetical protein
MPTLSFEGETQDEIVRKVKRWLASVEGDDEAIGAVEAVERASELTKDALGVIAAAAPGPIAHSEVMKALTRQGYKLTDQAKQTVVSGLNTLADLTNGGVLRRAEGARKSVVYEMNAAVAKQVLKALRG